MIIRWMLVPVLVLAAGYAQDAPPARGRGPFGPPPGFGGPRGGARFIGAEAGMPGRVVKGAPYSADVVTESVQTLADGNRIRQTGSARVYRDSEGRTRREQTLNSLGGLAPNAKLPPVVFINDPVAGANYALNANDRTATKSVRGPGNPAMRQAGAPDGQNPPGSGGRARFGEARARGNVKTESLGRQTIEGVQADGTRTTVGIPAGQMGNEQPMQIVSETWYSADLQTVVLAKRTDPRMGETVTRLANISRAEPARTLFEVPADFKVTEGPRGGGRMPPGANR
jgi:hypothetical protein